jgi:hypothetical protein
MVGNNHHHWQNPDYDVGSPVVAALGIIVRSNHQSQIIDFQPGEILINLNTILPGTWRMAA